MREFLKGLELDKETIDTIMAEHGKLLTGTKEKNETLSEQLKAAQEGLAAANTEIESFKSMDIDSIKKAADDYKSKYEEAEKEAASKIADMEYTAALKDALADEKFSSEYARSGIINDIRAKGLKYDGGKILGLEDALTALKEAQPEAFKSNIAAPVGAEYAGDRRHQHGAAGVTLEAYKKMKQQDKIKFKQENPTLYMQFKAALGF